MNNLIWHMDSIYMVLLYLKIELNIAKENRKPNQKSFHSPSGSRYESLPKEKNNITHIKFYSKTFQNLTYFATYLQ